MQLVAYGAQDIYLTGNPQITFFKVVYRRHTNFSMEAIEQTFNGTAALGSDVSATISRNGDLVHRLYLQHSSTYTNADGVADGDRNVSLVERYGESIIKECELEIGGQMIDKHTSMWNRVWSDLTEENPSGHFGATAPPTNGASTAGNGTLYQKMTGSGYGLNSDNSNGDNALNGNIGNPAASVNGLTYTVGGAGTGGSIAVSNIMMPLNFWFCRNPGLALPLIALQYHEVKVKMTFETIGNLVRRSGNAHFANSGNATTANVAVTNSDFTLFADYIYLDTDERRRFAQVSHEYLIEQLQYSDTIINQADVTIDLNFNHPVKELVWCMRNETSTRGGAGEQGRSQTTVGDAIGDCSAGPVSVDGFGGNFQLKLNGHDRFAERDARYFTRAQVWEHHSGYGSVPTMAISGVNAGNENDPRATKVHGVDAIAVYSFALKPEEHQPSGTCNFSRIDNAQLTGNALTVETTRVAQSNVGVAHESANVRLTIFAVNYNVLRIMSGMGGLAYSN